ncbi:DEAD/DEAH box helicase [Hyphococcus flavus]|uniref:DEAD-box ATP-dependent RNA helicase RhpA n=1 Tax=Hyphococcus flavus TaxID=1866326 RepID=A0AAE9ZBM0_9PROT|nr:DEAD/DEAH box helicase [Hyphococcus flavus]WDI31779.1 DEAD/DEAH box helicase [Hyphococcus flavus]
MSFAELGLSPKLLEAIAKAGYETPTPIQEQAIPPATEGRDVLGIAQTGTGKTASFTLPMIERLSKGRARARMPRSLVLAPTRELAAQVAENFEKYGINHKLSMALLIGGVSFGDQDAKLTRGVDVLIATPGRLLDHFERGRLLLTGIEVMVIDEADRMLDMGFIPDIEKIFKLTPITRQTLFFSATMPPEIQRITDQFLHNPVRVEVAKPATTADTITQRIVNMPSKDDKLKRNALRELLGLDGVKNGIIFCNRKSTVDIVAKSLQKHGFNARPIHGDLAQAFRTETLDKFRNDEIQFLVASDVAARGLDIPAVSHVFNYDVPIHADDYVHRIGRTGRAGRKGAAMMLVTPADSKYFDAILKTISADEIQALDFTKFFEENPGTEKRRRKPDDKRKRTTKRNSRKDGDAKADDNRQPEASLKESGQDDNQQRPGRRKRSESKSSSRRREKAPEPVVGLGEHVPAFMTRAVAR